MDLGLSGKTAVVAGGSRSCGRGVSEVLAAEGAAVVFSGRHEEPVTATETAIRAGSPGTCGPLRSSQVAEGDVAAGSRVPAGEELANRQG